MEENSQSSYQSDMPSRVLDSQESPWGQIISKYLNGTADKQLADHRDLFEHRCSEPHSEDRGSECRKCEKKSHHHRHHHHKHRRQRHKTSLKKSESPPHLRYKQENHRQHQTDPVNVLSGPSPAEIVWTSTSSMPATVAAGPAMILAAPLKVTSQSSPCYFSLPITLSIPGQQMYPTMVASMDQPMQQTQNQPRINYRDERAMFNPGPSENRPQMSPTDEDLLFSNTGMDENLFGDNLDLESADEAQERYQQLYEAERRRSK